MATHAAEGVKPEAVAGPADYFHRQRCVPGWDDAVIARQVAVVLGAGGIGSSMAMCLGRLGVAEIILLDRDTVDATNLNRQVLFTPAHVGRSKVEAAAETLRTSHAAMRTTVTPIHADIIREWGSVVVPLLDRATVVFNAIDWGGSFDAVVNVACRARGLPYLAASSYATTAISEGYNYAAMAKAAASGSGDDDHARHGCWACANASGPMTLWRWCTSEAVAAAPSLVFLPRDPLPPTGVIGSSVLPCTMAAECGVNLWISTMFLGPAAVPQFNTMDLASMTLTSFHTPRDEDCPVCGPTPLALRATSLHALAYGGEPVILRAVPGVCHPYKADAAGVAGRRDRENGRLVAALADIASHPPAATGHGVKPVMLPRLAPVPPSTTPGTPANVYVPCIPAVDLPWAEYMAPPLTPADTKAQWSTLPSVLRQPLMKAADGTVHGVRSGTRSAIVFDKAGVSQPGVAYRLKGCNCYILMEEDGKRLASAAGAGGGADAVAMPAFPTVPLPYHEAGGMQVRGCQFQHTALREQAFAGRIGSLLAPHGLTVGNHPVGITQYDTATMDDPSPAITKYCGLFRTVGEKRLHTHAMTGLEVLLPHLLPDVGAGEAGVGSTWHSLVTTFPSARIVTPPATPAGASDPSAQVSIKETYAACLTGAAPLPPTDFRAASWRETVAAVARLGDTDAIAPFWRPLWSATVSALADAWTALATVSAAAGSAAPPATLPYLYWRLGWEVGAFQRLLHRAGISWGYFYDHCEFEPHNNAHPNNFVLVADTVAAGGSCGMDATTASGLVGHPVPQYLAPVDFDMTFERAEFVSNFSGVPDDDQFHEYVTQEQREMQRVLGGDDVSNTGIALDGTIAAAVATTPAHGASGGGGDPAVVARRIAGVRTALRDTMLVGWGAGWHGAESDAGVRLTCTTPIQAAQERCVQLLLRLALMVSDGLNS